MKFSFKGCITPDISSAWLKITQNRERNSWGSLSFKIIDSVVKNNQGSIKNIMFEAVALT